MVYVFDTNSFITIFTYYYKTAFKTFWINFEQAINENSIISVREVLNEINIYYNKDSELTIWANANKNIVKQPTENEMKFITDIFKEKHFQAIISKRSQLEGRPVADPFLVAKAMEIKGIVVTQEKYKENAVKIPNICDHFKIECTDLEGFMQKENWNF